VTTRALRADGSKVPPELLVTTVPFGIIPEPEPEVNWTGAWRVMRDTFVNATPLKVDAPESAEPDTLIAPEKAHAELLVIIIACPVAVFPAPSDTLTINVLVVFGVSGTKRLKAPRTGAILAITVDPVYISTRVDQRVFPLI
jgi:hypothetical protein